MMLALKITAAALAVAVLAFLASFHFAAAAQPGCGGRSGQASWYGAESGSRTATGAYFDGTSMTAAMLDRSLFGRRVRVTREDKSGLLFGGSITVTVNDYGPAKRLHRIIDLSRAAARRLGTEAAGTARVCVEPL